MRGQALPLLPLLAGALGYAAFWLLSGGPMWLPRDFAEWREPFVRACAHLGRKPGPKAVRAQVTREMPVLIDIVTLGLSAGLSFDASVDLYCRRYGTTRVGKALQDACLSWRMGLASHAQALDTAAKELDCAPFTTFSATVAEALQLGTPLSQALERQAEVIRDELRSQMEEEIERAPVKMLVPLGTLIVPAMLLAILGPLLGPAMGMA